MMLGGHSALEKFLKPFFVLFMPSQRVLPFEVYSLRLVTLCAKVATTRIVLRLAGAP